MISGRPGESEWCSYNLKWWHLWSSIQLPSYQALVSAPAWVVQLPKRECIKLMIIELARSINLFHLSAVNQSINHKISQKRKNQPRQAVPSPPRLLQALFCPLSPPSPSSSSCLPTWVGGSLVKFNFDRQWTLFQDVGRHSKHLDAFFTGTLTPVYISPHANLFYEQMLGKHVIVIVIDVVIVFQSKDNIFHLSMSARMPICLVSNCWASLSFSCSSLMIWFLNKQFLYISKFFRSSCWW